MMSGRSTSQGDPSSSDSNQGSSKSPERHRHNVDRENEKELQTQAETRAIFRLKLIMMIVLVGVAIGVGLYAYHYAKDVEHEEFKSTFMSQGTKLVSGFYQDSFQKLQAMESLSSSVTYLFRDETWPFVTIPDSTNFFKPFLTMAGAASIKFIPIVGNRQRLEWEQHVLDEQNWIQEAIAQLDSDELPWAIHEQDSQTSAAPSDTPSSPPSMRATSQPTATSPTSSPSMMTDIFNSTLDSSPRATPVMEEAVPGNTRRRRTQYFEIDETIRVSPYIKSHVGVDTSPGVWTPVWQYSPVVPNNNYFINFNQLVDDDFQEDFPILTEKKNAVLARTESYQAGLDFQSTRDLEFTQEVLQISGYGTYQQGEPIGFLHYPVFESSQERDKVVAVLTATVYWKSYFQNILPDSAIGIICVVENEEQQFTYRIDGSDAIFLGNEDLHDPKYNDFEIAGEYKALDSSNGDDGSDEGETNSFNRIYTGVPVDESRLNYKIRIYPSQEMADIYLTNEPVYYACVVAGVMLIAVFVFVAYDKYVEIRQKKISALALRSNAIVSSLFPKQIKDKLYNQANTTAVTKKDVFRRSVRTESRRNISSTGSPKLGPLAPLGNDDPAEAPPIADFFPSATVMFLDIAGFTAWSSSREPSQVFILLESLFKSFDKMALRRRVFKVETIGTMSDFMMLLSRLKIEC